MFSLKTLILSTFTMNLWVYEQMTGCQEHLTFESLLHCSIQSKFFQDFAFSVLASFLDSGYSSLFALNLFPSATFAQLIHLIAGFYIIACFLQQGIFSSEYPTILR